MTVVPHPLRNAKSKQRSQREEGITKAWLPMRQSLAHLESMRTTVFVPLDSPERGMKKRGKVDCLVIQWPSGRTEEYKNLAAGRAYQCVRSKRNHQSAGFPAAGCGKLKRRSQKGRARLHGLRKKLSIRVSSGKNTTSQAALQSYKTCGLQPLKAERHAPRKTRVRHDPA